MRKNPHSRILKEKPKEQYLNTVPKFYSLLIIPLINAFIFKFIAYRGT